ncbi:oxidoreductase [Agrocybe pediades]|nr:oxidoreductase [Agrocybe pediades]
MSATKRIRIYTAEDVATHNQASSCWVSHAGKVYDVSNFLNDHPGGDDLILQYAGKNVEEIMKDKLEHEHSDSAYSMLDEYVIGRLGTGDSIVRDDWEAPDDFHPEETDTAKDYEKNTFLDLRKPLLRQVWESDWSKSYYLQQIHQPRHLHESARLFGPDILEMCTRTEWYVVPLFWLPISAYLSLRSIFQFTGPLPNFFDNPALPLSAWHLIPVDSVFKFLTCFSTGILIWTFLEYTMHRFLFHIDNWLPDKPLFLMLHFLGHGVHHYLPMDRLRLVMPPPLFIILETPFTQLAYKIFPVAVANGIIAGAFFMYVGYDCMHYALHHTKLPQYMKDMKKYHLAHHYKNFELGYGVTSKIWDYVFNTVLPV